MNNLAAKGASTIFVDADNTLWDTDAVFAGAQVNLLTAVEHVVGRRFDGEDRLEFVRAADQVIAERHHAGLRYPPRLLIASLAAALVGEDVDRAARRALTGTLGPSLAEAAISEIEQAYFADLGAPPQLRPGVEAGLRRLIAEGATVLIISEGDAAKVERNAERLGLRGHFTRIVEGVKRPDLYRRILRLTGTPPTAFMIGDQLDRDIAPAKTAGLRTIYYPGGFQPRWTPEVEAIRPDHIITNFSEVPAIVRLAIAHRARGGVRSATT
ncbi:HAD family hydrolase [Sphingopyxis sp. JAI108]|uniref:HAD family hydrolase n=1 Tax=Sphingopyxis sp. JAI108 TaxID=2723060 RepID=UPI0015C825F5|nr:HAD family hydrolase [Sphingopyxis sp. JAI108]NYF30665.1 putative hydrolase of the HAD superfamily [Sphingopyxis sp. JAI108]